MLSLDKKYKIHKNECNDIYIKNYLANKVVLFKNNKHYRFGDVIFHKGHYWKKSVKFILEANKSNLFKNTILEKYCNQSPDKNLNQVNPEYKALLLSIINDKINEQLTNIPTKNELVIHLRTGDVVEFSWFLEKDYESIISNYLNKHKNIDKITFCTAFHYGNFVEKKLWIYSDEKHNLNLNKLSALFLNLTSKFPHIQFNIQSSKNIDFDFIYMVKSTYFIGDQGGFSELINILRS